MPDLSPQAWKLLLSREKKRRGVPSDQLVFAGLHNVAQHWWCAEYALQKSWANELTFFRAYVDDRLRAAEALGLADTVPSRRDELLELCASLGPDHGEQMLARVPSPQPGYGAVGVISEPAMTAYQKGEQAQNQYAERYPTVRWHWAWQDMVLVGLPDGLTDEFVYEFKSAKNAFMARYSRPVARTQGDLYGLFWGRSTKRIDVLLQETGERKLTTVPIDHDRAEETLAKFRSGVGGQKTRPPARWKCRNCEHLRSCRIKA